MPRPKRINTKAPIKSTLDRKAFGKKVSQLMVEREYTNEMFAEIIGVSVSTVIAIKSGERLPGLDNYLKILEALETCDIVMLHDSIDDEKLKSNEIISSEIIPLLSDLNDKQLYAIRDVIEPLIKAIKS